MAIGIDEPPFAIDLLRAEAPRGGKLRTSGPATIAVWLRNGASRIFNEPRILGDTGGNKIFLCVNLSWPIAAHVLPEHVHKG